MITSYRASSNHPPSGALHGYMKVDAGIRTDGFLGALRLNERLTTILRLEGFSRSPFTGRFEKHGIVVTCRTNFLNFDHAHGVEFTLRAPLPTLRTDKLMARIDNAIQAGKNPFSGKI